MGGRELYLECSDVRKSEWEAVGSREGGGGRARESLGVCLWCSPEPPGLPLHGAWSGYIRPEPDRTWAPGVPDAG